jgi:hypothetical protein
MQGLHLNSQGKKKLMQLIAQSVIVVMCHVEAVFFL